MLLKLKKLHPDAIIPEYQTSGSAGFDVHSIDNVTLTPQEKGIARTGLAFELPENTCMFVCQRSGISKVYPNYINNAPGIIDSDYRGELIVIINNHNNFDFKIKKGDRIAQCIIVPVMTGIIMEVEELNDTKRGKGGFGSTGM